MTTIPPVGPGAAHLPDKNSTTAKAHGTPSQEEAARFSKALDKPKDGGTSGSTKSQVGGDRTTSDNPSALFRRREGAEQYQGQSGGRGDSRGGDSRSRDSEKTKERHDEPVSPGNAMLHNMQPKSAVDETAPVEPPSAPNSSLSDMVQQVADRILVGDSGDTGQPEVRIMLKNEVLDGTEVRISENAGAYEITFVADNKDVENFLANRQEQISTALGEKLDREIKVAVTDRDGTPNQSGDERGRQQGQGQPDDGRSRNQRSVQDEREG
jgi:type III secretion system needle length determinant